MVDLFVFDGGEGDGVERVGGLVGVEEVYFVAQDDGDGFLGHFILGLFEPEGHIVEAGRLHYIIDDDEYVCVWIVERVLL